MLASPSAPGGLLDHLDQPPRLAPRERPAGRDGHEVADVGLAVLIVSEELRGAPHVLAVRGVLDQPLDLDGDRLLHLVAHHAPGEGALAARSGGRRCGVALVVAHFFSPAALRSRRAVFTRAMLRRAAPNWSGFGAWPVARCSLRANCSLRSFTNSSASSAGEDFASFSRNCLICPSFITEPAVWRKSWTPTASSRRAGTPRGPSPRRRPPSRREPCRAGRARRSTRRYPCRCPCGPRAASC